MHLVPKEKHEEFTVIRVNLNTIRRDSKEHLYNENDLYLESNNIGYYSIV